MEGILVLGFISALLQITGYYLYITKTRRDDISPNPTTWIIFAFDTTLLTVLEFVAGATLPLLILPSACALGSLYVAWLVRKAGRLHWPKDRVEAYILSIGIFIAVSYTVAFTLWHFEIVPDSWLYFVSIVFLFLSNINTFVAFVPIIREVYADPFHEHAFPWAVWTTAYALLGVITYIEIGWVSSNLILYAYPISCVILHGCIAVLARDSRKTMLIATHTGL